MFNAVVSVEDGKGLVARCFAPEDREIRGRASYNVSHRGGVTRFEVRASDSVSLRTVLNSVTKMLTVIERVSRLE